MKNTLTLTLPVNGEGTFPPVYGGIRGVNVVTYLKPQKTELLRT